MKQYYFTDGQRRYGPFTYEALQEQNITHQTLVWYPGLDNWTPAGETEELQSLFAVKPPPLDNLGDTPGQEASDREESESGDSGPGQQPSRQGGAKDQKAPSHEPGPGQAPQRAAAQSQTTGRQGLQGSASQGQQAGFGGNRTAGSSFQQTPGGPPTPPKSWLVESILVTLFCCLPFGIAGIVNASKVESRFHAGDAPGAERASSQAKKWTQTGFWIGLIAGIIYVLAIAIGGGSSYY